METNSTPHTEHRLHRTSFDNWKLTSQLVSIWILLEDEWFIDLWIRILHPFIPSEFEYDKSHVVSINAECAFWTTSTKLGFDVKWVLCSDQRGFRYSWPTCLSLWHSSGLCLLSVVVGAKPWNDRGLQKMWQQMALYPASACRRVLTVPVLTYSTSRHPVLSVADRGLQSWHVLTSIYLHQYSQLTMSGQEMLATSAFIKRLSSVYKMHAPTE